MEYDDFAREEKSFTGTIEKIKLLNELKPKENWVIFCRANLVMRLEMERKKELINKDFSTLKELFSFLRVTEKPRHSYRFTYAVLLGLATILATGGVTVWASTKSLPGSQLYKVKIAVEKAYLLVATDNNREKLQSEMANRRLEELKIVINSLDSTENKQERVEEVVDHIQQQLITDQKQLPNAGQTNVSEKSIIAAKEVVNRAEQAKKAMVEVKKSLPEEIKGNLSEKLTEVTNAADKNSLQVLEMMINKPDKTDADQKEILARFNEIIDEKETIVKNLNAENLIVQATSTADKLPINAVLINQSEQALELLDGLKGDLEKGDLPAALEALKAINEIVKGAERIVENASLPVEIKLEPTTESQNSTSSPSADPSK
jgi:hypothetical protein